MRRITQSGILLIVLLIFLRCAYFGFEKREKWHAEWRAVHVINYETDSDLAMLGEMIPTLSDMGVNMLILEVHYSYDYKSHPELIKGDNPITEEAAHQLAGLCRDNGIRLIPEFQVLGHQSWAGETFPLLTQYPQFDLTPGAFPGNEGLYCREWDPLNPEINPIIFALMDELIDAFEPDAFHVGMDEVFLLGSEHSPSTIGQDPAKLYAKVINEYYAYLVEKHGLEMLMWGDRLIDGEKYFLGEWEASMNGTAGAVDMIPKDIIICPWHYTKRDEYPSIPMFVEKGFRVLPAGWRDTGATKALIRYSHQQDHPKILGHMFTTWGAAEKGKLTEFKPLVKGLRLLHYEELQ